MTLPVWLGRLIGKRYYCDADGCVKFWTTTADFRLGEKRIRRLYCTEHAADVLSAFARAARSVVTR